MSDLGESLRAWVAEAKAVVCRHVSEDVPVFAGEGVVCRHVSEDVPCPPAVLEVLLGR